MTEFIEFTLENNTKITVGKSHIVYIQPLANGKTRVTLDLKTSITESEKFVIDEKYTELIKRLAGY